MLSKNHGREGDLLFRVLRGRTGARDLPLVPEGQGVETRRGRPLRVAHLVAVARLCRAPRSVPRVGTASAPASTDGSSPAPRPSRRRRCCKEHIPGFCFSWKWFQNKEEISSSSSSKEFFSFPSSCVDRKEIFCSVSFEDAEEISCEDAKEISFFSLQSSQQEKITENP
jgi:hypothetical protein